MVSFRQCVANFPFAEEVMDSVCTLTVTSPVAFSNEKCRNVDYI